MKFVSLLILMLLPAPAFAGRYWATVAKITVGAQRPALGAMKSKAQGLTVAVEGENEELILVVIDDKDLQTLISVSSRVHGKEGSKVRRSETLKNDLLKEAKRLGAPDTWKPEDYDVVGE